MGVGVEEEDVYVGEGVVSPPSWEDWVVGQHGLEPVLDGVEYLEVVEE